MKIELLFIEGCPNYGPTIERIREALTSLGRADEIRSIEVLSPADAEALHFVGSPSVRVNGVDIELWAHTAQNFGLECRTYLDGSRLGGVPPLDLICQALRSQQE